MTDTRRTVIGLALVGALAAIVAVDRFSGGAAGAETEAPSQADILAQEASLTARMRAEADALDGRRATLDEAESAWAAARERMIGAGSPDIAFARLREIVDGVMTDLDLRMASASALPVETPMEGESLRVVGVRVEFEAADPQRIYTLIDRLEHLPEAAASVQSVRIGGPGRLGRGSATVVIELRALAWIGPDV
ncbi:MAG: hypothetical protein ACF8QF_08635 [Phycisphaerales bacterium]